MRPNPCWKNGTDCPDRHAGCHSECKKWGLYQALKEIDYEKRMREKEQEAYFIQQAIKSKTKTIKRKKKLASIGSHKPEGA